MSKKENEKMVSIEIVDKGWTGPPVYFNDKGEQVSYEEFVQAHERSRVLAEIEEVKDDE